MTPQLISNYFQIILEEFRNVKFAVKVFDYVHI
jgi:hypothetical protein